MSELLKPGQTVQTRSGNAMSITRFLGGGGQGEVYLATSDGRDVAVKWYFETTATDAQRQTIEALVTEGPPSERFLWPLGMLTAPGVKGFGYVMPLRPGNYKSLTDLMAAKISPSFGALITAGFELTKAFRHLHTKGLCYRDISFGNAFFDPVNGNVLVCDNDNVGVNRASSGGVLGTPDFMAPEVVRGEADPSTKTDLHSLAVLLFYMLFIGHPLQGRRIQSIRSWDRPARELLFGKSPVFIFDPDDTTNAAVSLNEDPSGESGGMALVYWNIYPEFLRETFTKAFTAGLRDPDARVTELEWMSSLARLRSAQVKCRCGAVNFVDPRGMKPTSASATCWQSKCRAPLKLPFRLVVGKESMFLNGDSKVFSHHLNGDFDMTKPVAEVAQHPTDPSIWGLRNLSSHRWVSTFPNGDVKDIDIGKSARLTAGLRLNFGRAEGEILF